MTATRHEESLSKVPISVTALTQEAMDMRGIKDFQDVARFTPGVNIDNSGTNNISIRGISSSGGAGTTGIYIDDTPIQIRALAFNPDDALPKAFDVDRIEVLRGPQGTLFGAGSEGGTVRYITTQPSLTKTSFYSREEVSYTQGGDPSYEAGVAGGMPIIDGTLGVRAHASGTGATAATSTASIRYRWRPIKRTPTSIRPCWSGWPRSGRPTDKITVTPSFYYQDRYRNDVERLLAAVFESRQRSTSSAPIPTQRSDPDRFYLTALKVEGDLGCAKLISNTSYYHRKEETGYDGTLVQSGLLSDPVSSDRGTAACYPASTLLDGNGVHLPAGATNYRSPASIDNFQQNITQEIRLQSNDPTARLDLDHGCFLQRQPAALPGTDPRSAAERTDRGGHRPALYAISSPIQNRQLRVPYDPRYPNDSYFLLTNAKDQQFAVFGEGTYSFTDQLKLTLGARYSKSKYSFTSLTGGPQLFLRPQTVGADKNENSFTPKVSFSYQARPAQSLLLHLCQGFPAGRRQQSGAACGMRRRTSQSFGIIGRARRPSTPTRSTVSRSARRTTSTTA